MTNIEAETRKIAKQLKAEQGLYCFDVRDTVSLAAGRFANMCAATADAGGLLPEMERELLAAVGGHDSCVDKRFAAALVELCAKVATLCPTAPGDAIRDAFVWTGWCHDGRHGSGLAIRVRLRGRGSLAAEKREDLQAAFGSVLLRELVTSEAVETAYKASRQPGPDTFWARAWRLARAAAVAEVFPSGLPQGLQVHMVFRRASQ